MSQRHDEIPRSSSSNSHRSSSSGGHADPHTLLDESPRFTDSLLSDTLGLSGDFSYSMDSSSSGSNHTSSFSFDSTYPHSDVLPPANSLLLNTSQLSSPQSHNDTFTFNTESSPTAYHFSDNLPYHTPALSSHRLDIPRLEIPATSVGLSSPGYLGHNSLTASPSTSGHSNNSPFTPSTMHPIPMTSPVHISFPQTPSAISPYLSQVSMDFSGVSSVQHSPVSSHFGGLGLYTMPKSPSTYNFLPALSVPSYSPAAESSHSFEEVPATASPAVINSSPAPPTVYELIQNFGLTGQGVILPQRVYRPHTQSDRRRYVEEVILEAPIMFYMQNPDGVGISCRDALNSKFMRLNGRDDQMFNGRGPSVSIRLMWPGYAPWSRQIPTRDFRTPPGPITRSKLAKNVAKTVDRFLVDMLQRPMEEDADPRWRVGPNNITIDDLDIVGLQHVSMGSWQVHLRVRNRHSEVYTDRTEYRDPLKARAKKSAH